MRIFLAGIIVVLLALPAWAGDSGDFRFGVNPDVRNVRGEKPVKIKLKRTVKGTYIWEITGDDARKIIEADRKLREEYKK